jgi:hypothetical protein
MSETLIDGVKAQIEEKTVKNDIIFVKGWSFNEKFGVCPVRCKFEGTLKSVEITARTDICEKFKRNNLILCGWTVEVPQNKYIDIQMKFDSEWHTIMSFNTFNSTPKVETKQEEIKQEEKPKNEIINNEIINNEIQTFINQAVEDFKRKYPNIDVVNQKQTVINLSQKQNNKQNLIIIDNFYVEPDSVREIGKSINPKVNLTHSPNHFKPIFEKILGIEIDTFNKYENDNKFVSSNSNEPIIIDTKNYEYGAFIFLTPDAPINAGITLYRSKHTKNMTVSDSEKTTVFQNGNQDITEFEPVDIIGNVYNRLVIFNTQLIHAVTHNFGTNFNNNRLVQVFAFDTKKSASDTTKISLNL